MSTPENPLARYRSYSYHHILVACENSSVASYLLTSTDFFDFFLEKNPAASSGRVGTVAGVVGGNKYVVIFNGMVDAHLSIRNLSWETLTAANAVDGDRNTSMAVEGTMNIDEPRGWRFFEIIKNACATLNKDMIGVVWMVKTIFVGHGYTESNGDFTEMMTNIKPLLFYIQDVVGSFDETGSHYEIKFVGNNDGVARLPQMMRVADGITVKLGQSGEHKDVSLANAMLSLQNKVNQIYEKYYNCVSSSYVNALNKNTKTKITSPPFEKVLYLIKVDSPYDDKSKYKVTDGPQQIKDGIGTCEDPLILKLGESATVEQGMREIMSRCLQVKADTSDPVQKYTYKITSTIKSGADVKDVLENNKSIVGQVNGEYDYVIIFRVHQFPTFTNDLIGDIMKMPADDAKISGYTKHQIKQNLLTLDYIYTGKNIDIISFDMKMQGALSFLQIITTTNNLSGQMSGVGSRINTLANSDNRLNPNVRTPLFLSTPIKDPSLRNSQDSISSLDFASAMSAASTLEVGEATVVMLGNPYLMGALGSTDYQKEERRVLFHGDTMDSEQSIFSDWGDVPALAKINVRMPKSNDDLKSMEQGGGDYTAPFWYQDYFYVYGIKHMFADGLFTQELSLIALPNQSKLDQYFKQGAGATDDASKGVLCNEYVFGGESTHTGVVKKVLPVQQYTKSQMDLMTITLRDAAREIAPVMDLMTIQITRAIVLNESAAGDFFKGKQKIGDLNKQNPSYGITQFQLATARSVMKKTPKLLTYFNNLTNSNISDVDLIPDEKLIEALFDDKFALASTMCFVDYLRKTDTKEADLYGTKRFEFPEYVFRHYNSSRPDLDYPNTNEYARNSLRNLLNIQSNTQTEALNSATGKMESVESLSKNIFAGSTNSIFMTGLQNEETTIRDGEPVNTNLLIEERIAQLDGRPIIPGKSISPLKPNSKQKIEKTSAGNVLATYGTFDSASNSTQEDSAKAAERQTQKENDDKNKKDCRKT
jgi:hypothetical protein